MALASGTRLGPYEIDRSIGAGGMGEVYKARDTRLERPVAIKVLPAQLAADPQFLERFEREAKSISALNHPNICTLYDIGESAGTRYLVLEYLEGETLAARIAKGPLPLPDVLKTAIEIASALDKAHRQGIVHRDLKPGNVMLTKTGSKLLDFGLAAFTQPAAFAATSNSQMPTMAAPLTAQGTILGTFQYMAPEQIEGEQADARSDIFAFGSLLYEMLTGQKAFAGKSQAGLLSAILKDDPTPVSTVQPMTPPALARVIRTCMAKDPDDRLQTAHDLWLQLQWVEEGGSAAGLPAPVVTHRKRHERAVWAAAVLAALALGAAVMWWLKPPAAVAHVVSRFRYSLPEDQNFTRLGRHDITISPDGTKLAYVANQQLYLRTLDQLEAQPVRGTDEDPMEPVFSPDGQWLAYFAPVAAGAPGGAGAWILKKIAVTGGAPLTLGQLEGAPYGATWSNGTIAFGVNYEKAHGIQAVPDSGGALQTVVATDLKKEYVAQPQLLADGKHVLFESVLAGNTVSEGQLVIQSLNGDGKDRRTLVNGGADPRVLPAGQLVYIHLGTLLAVPFDISRLAVTGGPVPLVESVTEGSGTWSGQFAVSSNGTLAYRPGTFTGGGGMRSLVWVDRDGHEEPIPAKPRTYAYPRLSPDGTKIAVDSRDEESDIWVFDLAKNTLTRLTFGPAFDLAPVWAPDGKSVFFGSGPTYSGNGAPADILRKSTDGTGTAEALTQRLAGGFPLSVSPDRKSVVYRGTSDHGLFLLPLDPKGEAHALILDPKSNALNAEISPDGRWIAYDSNESGRNEVYVRPFPAVDTGRWQISSEGGTRPLWARSGRELFFATTQNRMITVPIVAGSTFTFGQPQQLFDYNAYASSFNGRPFDISADGKRFLMTKAVSGDGTSARPSIVVVTNWFDEVKARMPAPH
jgi:Tol biopolymer transport system component